MNRREFLALLPKVAIATYTTVAIPALHLFPERPPFDPTAEYGNAITYLTNGWQKLGLSRDDYLEPLFAFLKDDAKKFLPPGNRFEIREQIPMDFGQMGGMAWFYSPGFGLRRSWDTAWRPTNKDEAWRHDIGCWIHRRCIS